MRRLSGCVAPQSRQGVSAGRLDYSKTLGDPTRDHDMATVHNDAYY